MNAEQRQRVSDAVEREHPWPGDDEIAGHPFAADSDEPTHEVVALVMAPQSDAARLDRLESECLNLRSVLHYLLVDGRSDDARYALTRTAARGV